MRRSVAVRVRLVWLTSTTLRPRLSTKRVTALSHSHRRTRLRGMRIPEAAVAGRLPGAWCRLSRVTVTAMCGAILSRRPAMPLSR